MSKIALLIAAALLAPASAASLNPKKLPEALKAASLNSEKLPEAPGAAPLNPEEAPEAPGAADLITDLPGLPAELEGQLLQYSGYLDGGSGRRLHYWFVESQNSPSDDPLLLWLNGGPGCSSLDGFLAEHGPFKVKDDFTLETNPFSWTTFANIIYLESPACVGFSYSETGDCEASDDLTVEQNYAALKDFFVKFPSFRDHELFVTAESYGGIYAPTLAAHIVQNNQAYAMNLVGVAIGNGMLSYRMNSDSMMFYENYHALIGQSLWEELLENCCTDGLLSETSCNTYDGASLKCSASQLKAFNKLDGINIYNIYGECKYPTMKYSTPLQRDVENLLMQPGLKKSHPQARLTPPCIDVDTEIQYLNSPDVRAALHIPDHVQDWELCSDVVNARYHRDYDDMTPQMLALKEAGVRTLIFNGDFDLACNFIGNIWFVESLGYNLTEAHRSWKVGTQVAGTVKRWDRLDMVTVKGAGHMVPEDKPVPALKMIMAFVLGTDY